MVRYPWRVGQLTPSGQPDTVVSGLPGEMHHSLKTIAFDGAGGLSALCGSADGAEVGAFAPIFVVDPRRELLRLVLNTMLYAASAEGVPVPGGLPDTAPIAQRSH